MQFFKRLKEFFIREDGQERNYCGWREVGVGVR
jgi:hypothetical protein